MGVVLVVALALLLVGCSDSPPDYDDPGDQRTRAGEGVPIPPDLAQAFTATLDTRAAALRDRDLDRFLTGIDHSEPGFVAAQRGYFDNLAQLPLGELSYGLERSSMVRAGDDYWVAVDVTMQLDGFDPEPVVSRDRFRFAVTDGGYVVSSTTDTKWERANDVRPQPWDMVPIQVRTRPGVLGVFDDGSVDAAEPILDSVAQGINDVSSVVPYGWSSSVVVYALSDTDFLKTLDDLPGGDPEHVDGVAFPVTSGDDGDVVTTRFALNPSMLYRPGPERDRLIRHELTHVALGERDDRAPAWLAEGIAEWVSVQALPPELRRLPEEALGAAEAGVHRLPADDTFNDADSAAHYGVSWWACEYLVASFGTESLWRLLDELDRPHADQAEVLQSLTGLTGPKIAKRGATMMINEYDPDFLEPAETETPTTPATPSVTPSGVGGTRTQ
jgi:hypothetical protein